MTEVVAWLVFPAALSLLGLGCGLLVGIPILFVTGLLSYAAYDPGLRFEVDTDPDVEPHRLEVTTGTDGLVAFDRIAVLRLPDLGDLDVWWLAQYGSGLFVPVKDALSGRETYGGGRYLLDTVKGADLGGDVRDGVLVLDLNFAYNPSCAYDPAWACPLAPPGNVLTAPVPAGELHQPPDDRST